METTLIKHVLTTEAFRNKVLGCWMGKTIGGTLGLPFEGTPNILKLNYYDPVPDKPLGNDDLDLQLVWLHQLVEKGIHLTEHDIKQAWLDFVKDPFPDEYAKCYINMKKGLEKA